VQDREGEAPARPQRGADGPQRAVEVINVGEAEAAHRQVEFMAGENSWRRYVGVDVADAQPLGLLGLLRFPDQVPGDIDAHHVGAAPRQFAGDAPVPARDIEDAQAGDRPQQAQEGERNRVAGRVETPDVEVSNRVIPGLRHASTVNLAHQPGAGRSSGPCP
jgi:hypothetical protein